MNRRLYQPYETLPSRQDVTTTPLPGTTYRDEHQPTLVFVAWVDRFDWNRYGYDAFGFAHP